MKVSSEAERVELLARALDRDDPRVLLGIGDDAAILAPCTEPLVWTIDAQVEGVHFRRDLLTLEDLGARATMAAASDLAAMGARPIALLASLVLPPSLADEELASIARGQREASDAIGAPIVGGNLARGGELSITTTAIGAAASPLRRDGGRGGDTLWVAGRVGLAGAGLALLEARKPFEGAALRAAVAAWRRPRAEIMAGLAAAEIARAAIDLSDGLAIDLGRLARASGTGAVLDAGALADAELEEVARALGRDPVDFALHGGEDYALLVAAPPGTTLAGFRAIGALTTEPGLRLRTAKGEVAIPELGFDHFVTDTRPGR